MSEDIQTGSVRENIVAFLGILSGQHDQVSAEMMQKFASMKGFDYNLSVIGNNLRTLKKYGIVSDTVLRGLRYWKLTGKKYVEQEKVKMLLVFPKPILDRVAEFAKLAKTSKTAFIINMIEIGLKSLDPLKREIDFGPRGKSVPLSSSLHSENTQ